MHYFSRFLRISGVRSGSSALGCLRGNIAAVLLFSALSGLAWADGYVAAELKVAETPGIDTQRAVIFHRNGSEVLVVESPFRGKGVRFGWLLPVPSDPSQILPADPRLFSALFARFQPRVVDIEREGIVFIVGVAGVLSLMVIVVYLQYRQRASRVRMFTAVLMVLAGGLLILMIIIPSHLAFPAIPSVSNPEIRHLRVGAYDVTVLRPRNAGELQAWLSRNGYAPLSAEGEKIAAAVIRDGWCFVAAQLRREAPGTGAELTPHPLEVHFRSPRPVYPLRLTALVSRGLDLDLIVVAEGRADADSLEPTWCGRFLPDRTEVGARLMTSPDLGERNGNPILLRNGWEGCCLTRLQGKLLPSRMTGDLAMDVRKPVAFRKTIYTATAALVGTFGPALLILFLVVLAVALPGWEDWLNGRRLKVYRWVLVSATCLALAGGCAGYLSLEKVGSGRIVRLSYARRMAAFPMLRNLASAEVEYSASAAGNGAYGTLPALARAGVLDPRFLVENPVIDGFTYSSTVTSTGFTVQAVGPSAGPEWNLLVREDGVIRMSDETPVE